jgi:hypothetical protein
MSSLETCWTVLPLWNPRLERPLARLIGWLIVAPLLHWVHFSWSITQSDHDRYSDETRARTTIPQRYIQSDRFVWIAPGSKCSGACPFFLCLLCDTSTPVRSLKSVPRSIEVRGNLTFRCQPASADAVNVVFRLHFHNT